MFNSGPAILSRYLGFKNPRAGLLMPLAFAVGGFLKWPGYYRQKYGEMAYRAVVLRHFLWAGILMFAGVLRPIWVAGNDVAWLPLWLRLVIGVYLLSMWLLL